MAASGSSTRARSSDGEGRQTLRDGIRSLVAMTWNPHVKDLYAVQHGRDDLYRSWPQYFSRWQSAVLPSEEFFRVTEGFDGGWPFYYFDWMQGKKLLNPEYGGDGKKEGKGAARRPLVGFPGHFAPTTCCSTTARCSPNAIATAPSSRSTVRRSACRTRRPATSSRSCPSRTASRPATGKCLLTGSPASIRFRTPAMRQRGRWAWPRDPTARCTSPRASRARCGASPTRATAPRSGPGSCRRWPRARPSRRTSGSPHESNDVIGKEIFAAGANLRDLLRVVPPARRQG